MKRTMLIVGGLTALAAAYVGSRLWAQAQTTTTPVAPAQTRVALVNIDTIFQKYQKAKVYDGEIKASLEPFKKEIDKLTTEMLAWQEQLKKPGLTQKEKESLEYWIVDHKRKREDLDKQARKVIGKKSEEQVVQLYKEIHEAVKAHALANGFHVVIAFGENTSEDPFSYPNIMRRVQAIQVSCMPMYFDPGLDISVAVAEALNRRYPVAPTAGTITPTGTKN